MSWEDDFELITVVSVVFKNEFVARSSGGKRELVY